jgi:hypothetical protein
MNTENQEFDIVTPGQEQAPQYTPIELKALEMGWRPKEEFDGNEEDFVDAKEFVGRKPLYDKIASTSKQLKNVTQAVEALKQHNGKIEEASYQRALKELKSERKQALIEGDADKFESLDEEIKTVERQVDVIREEQTKPIVQEEPVVHPEFQNWQNKNQWYTSVKYMRAFADELGGRLANTMSPSEVLKEVEKAVRREFPNKFVNPNKADAPDVGAPRGSGKGGRSESIEMTEQEVNIMNKFVRQGVMTKAEYIADLKKIKGIK